MASRCCIWGQGEGFTFVLAFLWAVLGAFIAGVGVGGRATKRVVPHSTSISLVSNKGSSSTDWSLLVFLWSAAGGSGAGPRLGRGDRKAPLPRTTITRPALQDLFQGTFDILFSLPIPQRSWHCHPRACECKGEREMVEAHLPRALFSPSKH